VVHRKQLHANVERRKDIALLGVAEPVPTTRALEDGASMLTITHPIRHIVKDVKSAVATFGRRVMDICRRWQGYICHMGHRANLMYDMCPSTNDVVRRDWCQAEVTAQRTAGQARHTGFAASGVSRDRPAARVTRR
jgi:hypothetical protein